MVAAVIMAMVDVYPTVPSAPGSFPSLPALPGLDKFQLPMQNLLIALLGGMAGVWIASLLLPKTPLYRVVVSKGASGARSEAALHQRQKSRAGQVGVTISALRPGGKAQFGEEILDVIAQGEMVERGKRVRIIGSSGTAALVEVVKES